MSDSSSLTQVIDSFLSGLSDREKILLASFVLVAIGIVAYQGLTTLVSGLDDLQQEKTELSETLSKIRKLKEPYLAANHKQIAYEKKIKDNQTDLGKVMERLSKEGGFQIDNFKEKEIRLDEGFDQKKAGPILIANTQEVTIRSISLKQLSTFLEKLENQPSPVRVLSLEVSTSYKDRQVLRLVKTVVATYKYKSN